MGRRKAGGGKFPRDPGCLSVSGVCRFFLLPMCCICYMAYFFFFGEAGRRFAFVGSSESDGVFSFVRGARRRQSEKKKKGVTRRKQGFSLPERGASFFSQPVVSGNLWLPKGRDKGKYLMVMR